jgi:uncharacterized protein YdaU (DUF1376 family)
MGKNPAFQFYPMDWMRDTGTLSLQAKGAWIDILCALWWSAERGVLSTSTAGWSRLIRASNDDVEDVIDEILTHKVADIKREPNGNITVVCRRMVRDEEYRQQNAERQRRHYKSVTQLSRSNNAIVTVPSSSSSSSSSSKNNIYTPKKISKKSKFAKLQNVLLTQEEFEKLKDRFNGHDNAMVWVEKMSIGIAMKGYKYKSHYLAILKWAENENPTEKLDSFKKPTEHIINYKELPVVVKGEV